MVVMRTVAHPSGYKVPVKVWDKFIGQVHKKRKKHILSHKEASDELGCAFIIPGGELTVTCFFKSKQDYLLFLLKWS